MNTQNADRLHNVLSAIEELGLFQAPRRVENSEFTDATVLTGEVLVSNRLITLWLVLDNSFPLRLPRFYLRPWDALGVIPHIDRHGMICFADPEGLVIDRQSPVQIIQEAFARAVRVLTDGVTGQNRTDFADEFEAYWCQLPGVRTGNSVFDPKNEVKRIIIVIDSVKETILAAGTESGISAFHNNRELEGNMVLQRALYLPLEEGRTVIPPRHDGPFWSAKDARRILLAALSKTNKEQLKKLLKRNARQKEYVIVKLPRPSGGATIFGIQYDVVGRHHPLHKDGVARRLTPLHFQRLDRDYLVQRGGGATELGTKRVLLVGCGAIGGHLAFALAHAGILHLTLMDGDLLLPENTFRHVLGRRYWHRKKVEALKEEIEAELPYVQVTAIFNTIEKALFEEKVNLLDYDLLVLATGNPTVELEINARVHAMQKGPAMVFTWLEPLGIGGHALLAHNSFGGGCFECLYTSPEENGTFLANRAAFAAPGQSFGRALSGCGSLFTPYGNMDAQRTATMAARLIVDALRGEEPGNPLLSWKGDTANFRAAGFQLSNRFKATEQDLQRLRYAYQNTHCRVCTI